jgi:diaminohydroxyphosphoribosylaminopyrimidine deaminase/5-amino-6-(5-phosphoribosylamino)uracil reductase
VSLAALLEELGRRRMTNLLVEGGSAVLGAFFDGGLADEFHVFVAPKLAGGGDAPSPVGGGGLSNIAHAATLSSPTVRDLEGDLYIHTYLP